MGESGLHDKDLSAINIGAFDNLEKTKMVEVQKYVDSIKGWELSGVFTKGVKIEGPFKKDIKPYDALTYADSGSGDVYKGLNGFRHVEIRNANFFTKKLISQDQSSNANNVEYCRQLRDLLDTSFLFVFKSDDDASDTIISFNIFQDESASTGKARYRTESVLVSLAFDKTTAGKFVEQVKNDAVFLDKFKNILFPEFKNEVNEYKSDGVRVFENGIPNELVFSNPVGTLDIGSLKKIKQATEVNSVYVKYPYPHGKVEFQTPLIP